MSGVGYLKVPEDLGKPIQENKENNYNGKLELIHGSKMFLCDPQFRVKPKVGDFYFFPHYLLHTVYPFADTKDCLLYTSPSPRDATLSRMPSSA